MKVILNDDGPAKSSKKDKPEKQPRGRSQRGGGFRRKGSSRAENIDELLASGADMAEEEGSGDVQEQEAPAGYDDGMPPPEPAEVEAPPVGAQPRKSVRMSRKAAEPATPDEDPESGSEPEATVEPEPEPEPEAELNQGSGVKRRSFGKGAPKGKTANKGPARKSGSTVKITVQDEDISKGRRSRRAKDGEEAGEQDPKPAKKQRQSKPDKPSKPAWEPKQAKQAKEPKPPRQNKRAKAEDAEFEENFAPAEAAVVVMPESAGSQIITLIEVLAGAAISFFAATQVGNILITNIMSGALGG